jgi:hypothetical protein
MGAGTTSFQCTCGGGTCACYWRGYNHGQTSTSISFGGYGRNNYNRLYDDARFDRALAEFKKSCEEAKFKQGWRLDAAVIEELKPATPRPERRAAPAPQLVGGGPMRRRWR